MPYSIWPTSPVPANIQRGIMWGESVQTYDSGAEQASTPWAKPLLQYTISLTNIPRTKQTSLHAFYRDICKAKTVPFLFADPYDYQIGGAVCVYSSATAVTPVSASGSSIVNALNPNSLPNKPITHMAAGGLSTVIALPASSDPNSQAFQSCVPACAAAA